MSFPLAKSWVESKQIERVKRHSDAELALFILWDSSISRAFGFEPKGYWCKSNSHSQRRKCRVRLLRLGNVCRGFKSYSPDNRGIAQMVEQHYRIRVRFSPSYMPFRTMRICW